MKIELSKYCWTEVWITLILPSLFFLSLSQTSRMEKTFITLHMKWKSLSPLALPLPISHWRWLCDSVLFLSFCPTQEPLTLAKLIFHHISNKIMNKQPLETDYVLWTLMNSTLFCCWKGINCEETIYRLTWFLTCLKQKVRHMTIFLPLQPHIWVFETSESMFSPSMH